MEYVLALCLVLVLSYFLNKINSNWIAKRFNHMTYSQSSIHNVIKDFLPINVKKKNIIESQSRKHVSEHMVKVIVIDNNAYWVKNNVFYIAETSDGEILHDTAKPIDTSIMSKEELDKMIFILDNLGRGDKNERGSSGN